MTARPTDASPGLALEVGASRSLLRRFAAEATPAGRPTETHPPDGRRTAAAVATGGACPYRLGWMLVSNATAARASLTSLVSACVQLERRAPIWPF